MKTAFIYKTAFTNGRADFMDLVVADDAVSAEALATAIIRNISDDLGCDEWAEVNVIGPLATDPASLAEEFTTQ